jgi:hypothetical protein
LREAIGQAKVTPKQNSQEVDTKEVLDNAAPLNAEYQQQVVKDIKKRLSADTDYKDIKDRFPNSGSL